MRGRLSAVGRRGEADMVGSAKQNSFDNAGSSNGRTQDFGSWYRGSIPCPAARGKALPKIPRVAIIGNI